jgi:hypothetical protein
MSSGRICLGSLFLFLAMDLPAKSMGSDTIDVPTTAQADHASQGATLI